MLLRLSKCWFLRIVTESGQNWMEMHLLKTLLPLALWISQEPFPILDVFFILVAFKLDANADSDVMCVPSILIQDLAKDLLLRAVHRLF